MNDERKDVLFKEIAEKYVEAESRRIRDEQAQLERENVRYVTHSMDYRVRRRTVAARSRRLWMQGIAAAAACLLLLIVVPNLLFSKNDSAGSEHSGSLSPDDEATLLPLSFTLPEGLSVGSAELDRGQSVYRLLNTAGDPVVLVMEESGDAINPAGLTGLRINNWPAYATAGADYNYLTFLKDGILYQMTCRHDINTLVELARRAI